MKTKIFSLIALMSVFAVWSVNAQYNQLFEQVHEGLKTDYMRTTLDNLRLYAEGTGSAKKDRVIQLSSASEMFILECNIAYNNALAVKEQLQEKNISKYDEAIEQVIADIYAMYYAANSLVEKCNWMLDKPKVHGGKTYNTMVDAYNTVVKNRNALSKQTSALAQIAILLSE